MATLHQVILRRTGVYILPGEPANRWIIETPTITEGLRHRVRRILGPRIEELTELGVAIAQDSRRSEERRVGKECRARWWAGH